MTTRAAFQAASLARGLAPTRDKLKKLRLEIEWHTRRDLGHSVETALQEAMRHIEAANDDLGEAIKRAKHRAEQEQRA